MCVCVHVHHPGETAGDCGMCVAKVPEWPQKGERTLWHDFCGTATAGEDTRTSGFLVRPLCGFAEGIYVYDSVPRDAL